MKSQLFPSHFFAKQTPLRPFARVRYKVRIFPFPRSVKEMRVAM